MDYLADVAGEPAMVTRWNVAGFEDLPNTCLVRGCRSRMLGERRWSPLWLEDGSMHKACWAHWQAIIGVLDAQLDNELDHHRDNSQGLF